MNAYVRNHQIRQHTMTERAPSDGLAARQAALKILTQVLNRKNPLDQVLDSERSFKNLPVRDRGFCRMLATTTLRRLGQIDDLITRAEDRPSHKNEETMNILRLGITQILFMDVPDHAAVDTCVRLAQDAGIDKQKAFINALLRTITRVGKEWLARQDEIRLNTPEWLLKAWIKDYDLRGALEIAKANMVEAPLDITIKDEKDRNYWASSFKAGEIGMGSLRCPGAGYIQDMSGFNEGMWWVQDASAAVPAKLFGEVAGQHVADLCAAPGGKTMQLAAAGARVTAIDRSSNRLKRLQENLVRTRLESQVDVVVADASEWVPKTLFSYILLDAPCTATGTIRRHPDIVHLKTERDLERLANIQERLLDNAFRILAPGGILIYCTCSLQKAEGEAQIKKLFNRYEEACKLPITEDEVKLLSEALTPDGDLRILPFAQAARGGMDGFFISRLTKMA